MRTVALAALAVATQASLTKLEMAQLANGVIEGFFGTGFGDISTCIQDVEQTASDVEVAVADIKAGGLDNIIAALKELGVVEGDIKTALSDCKQISADDWKAIDDAVDEMNSPISFAYHIGKDLLVNGSDIYAEIMDAQTQWDNKNYEKFGEDVGEAFKAVLIGKVDTSAEIVTYTAPSVVQIAEIVNGILRGALEAESSDLLNCLNDADAAVSDFNKAYQDFSKRTASGTADGLVDLGHALEDLSPALKDCSSVTSAWSTITTWAHTFTNPLSFAFHVGKDILVNGSDIYSDIEGAISTWNDGQYEAFGEDVGDALAKIIVGMDDMYVVQ
jgi:hypothetical protein